jgi:hypothetical protein
MEKPRICVCTAPEAATAHTSLLIVVIAGATAVGGGDFIVVSDVEFVVLLFVESVTMGCAIANVEVMTKSAVAVTFLIICLPFIVFIGLQFQVSHNIKIFS